MEGKTYICGLFYAEKPGEESSYANIKKLSTSQEFHEVYWRNILVSFSFAARTNPNAELILFSNETPRMEWVNFLNNIGVKIINVQYKSKPPKGYWHSWQSTFYIIDILESLKGMIAEKDYIYILDLDCIPLRNFGEMNKKLKNNGFLAYEINYDTNYDVNGLSREDFKNLIYDMYKNRLNVSPKYFGGEFYAFYGLKNVTDFHRTITELYQKSISIWVQDKNKKKCNTEEHIFSLALWRHGIQKGFGNEFVKRIWTAARYRNVEETDLDLTVWHLPAEKSKGIKRFSYQVVKKDSIFWKTEISNLPLYFGKKVSIPNRGPIRFFSDESKKLILKLTGIIK